METTSLPENRRAIPKHWIVLGLLVILHAGLGTLFELLAGTRSTYTYFRYFLAFDGFIAAQPILFAFWAAFAPQRFYHRLLWSLLLCILVSFVVDYGNILDPVPHFGYLMLRNLAIFLIAVSILMLVRRCAGWQITIANEESVFLEYQAHQFGIKHLILLTTIASIGFGLLRSLFLMNPSPYASLNSRDISYIAISIALLSPAIMLAWMMLARRQNVIFPVFLVLWLVVVDLLALWISQLLLPFFSYIDNILFTQLGAALSVLLTTLVMRFCGFRMIRVRKMVAPAGEA